MILIYYRTPVNIYVHCQLCNFTACVFKERIQYYDNALRRTTKNCWQNKGLDVFLPTWDAEAVEG